MHIATPIFSESLNACEANGLREVADGQSSTGVEISNALQNGNALPSRDGSVTQALRVTLHVTLHRLHRPCWQRASAVLAACERRATPIR